MRLILTRHGQTAWNDAHRIQGRTDIPLDARGHAQAEALAERLRRLNITAIYTSPLARAHETGLHVAALQGCPIYDDARLLERAFGDWEGEVMPEMGSKYPELWQRWIEDPSSCPVPNAETTEAVYARSLACVEELMQKYGPEDDLLIVSHATPVKLLLMHYIGAKLQYLHRLRTDNCSYSELEQGKNGALILTTCNETSYLRERGLL